MARDSRRYSRVISGFERAPPHARPRRRALPHDGAYSVAFRRLAPRMDADFDGALGWPAILRRLRGQGRARADDAHWSLVATWRAIIARRRCGTGSYYITRLSDAKGEGTGFRRLQQSRRVLRSAEALARRAKRALPRARRDADRRHYQSFTTSAARRFRSFRACRCRFR